MKWTSVLIVVWLVKYSAYKEGVAIPCNGESTVIVSTSPATYFRKNRCVTYELIGFSVAPRPRRLSKDANSRIEGSGTLK